MDDLVSGWESRLRELTGRMGHLFARPEPRQVFGDLVEGLLSDLEKKNCWTLAQRAGHCHPGRMQAFLSRGVRGIPMPWRPRSGATSWKTSGTRAGC